MNSNMIKKLNCTLNLERQIVGIKFIFTEEEFEKINVKQVVHKLSYCNTVRLATKGSSFKSCIDNFFCKASARALGLMDVNNDIVSGRVYHSYGMYNSLGVAKSVQKEVTYIDHKIYGVVVMPLEKFEEKPDIVIMIVNPYQAMRIVQGYSYNFGVTKNIKFTGNQGLCSECTATPYETNDLNVSLLCSNTRLAAKWEDSELGVGMPYHKFESVANGILETLNSSDPNKKKREMIERINKDNLDLNVTLNSSYYRSGK
ncbi:DUF169 domain-containing protein [Anaeromicrobium sediminis]|uniref:ArCR n=1 Tax=Anaeromicrobium sediminis TaxID=1478221 RepID=A0A267MJM1_9FIRM|nr:DUF169 domain-containing protein [Anaeromicrobium sediminis]PAB59794.1 hypothetical protein CCE28_07510 [Anaeromicrobium sediminis]